MVKELAEAYGEAGIRFGSYYSLSDMHHGDFATEDHENYLRYLHGQVRELCTNYGQIDTVWLDNPAWKYEMKDRMAYKSAKNWNARELFEMIRRRQPDAIIINRCRLSGDFDTAEREMDVRQAGDLVTITVPVKHRRNIDTIIMVELEPKM